MDEWNKLIVDSLSHLGWTGEAVLRLLLAAILGGIVGLEREVRGRQAGFRTNLLVGMGSALVMVVSVSMARTDWRSALGMDLSAGYQITVDPGRIAYGIMTGVGFLGAGAILKQGTSVRGLTTAAGLWCVAAIGLAAGVGLYVISMAGTVLVLSALWILDYFEEVLPRRRFRRIVVRCPWHVECVPTLLSRVQGKDVDVVDQSFRRIGDLSEVDVEILISYGSRTRFKEMEKLLHADNHCKIVSSNSV